MRHATFHVGGKTVHASIDGDNVYSAIPLTPAELAEIRLTDAVLTATQTVETVHAHPPKWRKAWRLRQQMDHEPGSEKEVPEKDAAGSDRVLGRPEGKA